MSKVLVHTQHTIEVLDIDKIVRYEGCPNFIKVHREDGSSMVSIEKLHDIISKMKEYFYQSHKSHLVNKQKVVRYHKSGFLELSNGDKVPVARRRRQEMDVELGQWIYSS